MNTVLHAAFTLIFALTALAGAVAAQSLPEKRSPDRGFRAGQAYSVSDIETVNTTNGNLILRLPVASLPAGRGGSGFTLSLFYNSKLYDSFAGPGNDPGGRVITLPMADGE